jgi:catechol 2,3-dioxygenase-like lactoylglutathione lyase family enzyme
MFDHVTIRVADFEASKRFYATVLAPLGLSLGFYDAEKRIAEWGDFVIVDDGKPVAQNVHVAFAAKDNATVEAFWQAGIDAGYVDNGAPGERPQYHAGYYAAFLLDPDGNNIEAVCHNRS